MHRYTARNPPASPILTSDTTACLDGKILGKPTGVADVHRTLRDMSRRKHRVLTAVTVVKTDGTSMYAPSALNMCFATLTDNDTAHYVVNGEPFGRVDACGVQGRAVALMAHILGSYSSTMGLPLFETAVLLTQASITL